MPPPGIMESTGPILCRVFKLVTPGPSCRPGVAILRLYFEVTGGTASIAVALSRVKPGQPPGRLSQLKLMMTGPTRT